MTKKLDLYDYKLLHELDGNSRKSASEIGKKIRLSKVSVNQRIKKLQNKGIISNFMVQVNYRKIGYTTCHAFYKLQNISLDEEKRFYAFLLDHRLLGNVARIDGNFDAYLVFLYKNNEDVEKILLEINQHFGKYIKERTILPVVNARYFGRRYLIKSESIPPIKREKEEKIIELNKVDHSLLQILSQNARIPIVELAEKLKITKDIAHYRIKKLVKEGILQKFTINLNHEKFGNSFYKILINQNYEKDENEFLSQISTCQNLIRTIKVIGSWDLELDFEVTNVQEMRAILKEIKETSGEYMRDYNSLFVYQTDKLNYYPF
ncbi:Lrp/AsnC family transcriptional regulator [Candidatus Woesearchaeota archaeon]|nr:Lrp/AsnC family transcriptional regulator [Candidatus Woesearchaeota archaeon]